MRNKDMSDSDHDNDSDDDEDDRHHLQQQHQEQEQQQCGVLYLNNAHQARLDASVQRVGVSSIAKEPWQQMDHPADDDDQQQVRRLFAQLIGVEAKDIAIMPSTAFAVTLAAHNILLLVNQRQQQHQQKQQHQQLQLHDPKPTTTTPCVYDKNKQTGRILVLQDEYKSAVYPWQEICHASQRTMTLDIVPYPGSNQTWTQVVMERLHMLMLTMETIYAVCLPPLHWADGSLLDLYIIGTFCQEHAIPFIVDATQAVGIFPLHNVPTMIPGCSMLACSVHKWLRGPSGMCLVYIHPDLHNSWQPLDQHAFGRNLPSTQEASRYSMGPNGYPETFYNDARKFDSGGKPNSLLSPMLRASLELVVQLDLYQVQEQLEVLMQPLLDWAMNNGFTIPCRHADHSSMLDYANHLVGIRPPTSRNISPDKLMSMTLQLQENKSIYIAARCGGFRISPYLDNNKQDIDRLVVALEEVVGIMNKEK